MKHILITVASIVIVILFLTNADNNIKASITGAAAYSDNLDYQIKNFLDIKNIVFPSTECTNLIVENFNKIIKQPVTIVSSYTTDSYKKVIFQQPRTKGTLEINIAQNPFYYNDFYYFLKLVAQTRVINTVETRAVQFLLYKKDDFAFAKSGSLIMPFSVIVFSEQGGSFKCQGYPTNSRNVYKCQKPPVNDW